KIADKRCAVMFLNNVDDSLIEFIFKSEINAFLHMRDDNQCAHRRREVIVRVALEAHVLSEIFRLYQLADIVEISADAAERCVCADRFRSSFCKIGYHQTVM